MGISVTLTRIDILITFYEKKKSEVKDHWTKTERMVAERYNHTSMGFVLFAPQNIWSMRNSIFKILKLSFVLFKDLVASYFKAIQYLWFSVNRQFVTKSVNPASTVFFVSLRNLHLFLLLFMCTAFLNLNPYFESTNLYFDFTCYVRAINR